MNKIDKFHSLDFVPVGFWILNNGEPRFSLKDNEIHAIESVIYAFICDGALRYIGETERKLSARMRNIQNNREGNQVREHIRKALKKEKRVDIYAIRPENLPPRITTKIRKTELSFDLGREAWEAILISDLNPQWNKAGRTKR